MIDWLFVLQVLGIFFASAVVSAFVGWAVVKTVMRYFGITRNDYDY